MSATLRAEEPLVPRLVPDAVFDDGLDVAFDPTCSGFSADVLEMFREGSHSEACGREIAATFWLMVIGYFQVVAITVGGVLAVWFALLRLGLH